MLKVSTIKTMVKISQKNLELENKNSIINDHVKASSKYINEISKKDHEINNLKETNKKGW